MMSKKALILLFIAFCQISAQEIELSPLLARSVFTSTKGRVLNLLLKSSSAIDFTDNEFPVRIQTNPGYWYKRTSLWEPKQPMTEVPHFSVPLAYSVDYELEYIRNISSVYEEYEPDEFCQFSKRQIGKCASAEAVFCCVNPFYEPDGKFGKPTGQYCMIKSPKEYPIFQPRFVGFDYLMSVRMTYSNLTQDINITSFQPYAITPTFTVQNSRLAQPIYGYGLWTVFDGPMITGVHLNSSSWFMAGGNILGNRPYGISATFWIESVKRNPNFCEVYLSTVTRTNFEDPKDQFKPLRATDDEKYAFDPDYETAELVSAREACARIGCNVFSTAYHLRTRASNKIPSLISVTVML